LAQRVHAAAQVVDRRDVLEVVGLGLARGAGQALLDRGVDELVFVLEVRTAQREQSREPPEGCVALLTLEPVHPADRQQRLGHCGPQPLVDLHVHVEAGGHGGRLRRRERRAVQGGVRAGVDRAHSGLLECGLGSTGCRPHSGCAPPARNRPDGPCRAWLEGASCGVGRRADAIIGADPRPSEPPCAMSHAPHPFDEAIRLEALAEGEFAGHSSPAYWNMVGPYGGITAAQLLQAMLQRPERLGDPVSLTVNFAGPVADGPLRIRTQLMRSNRSTQHWTATLRQGDTVAAIAMAVFGTRRPVWSHTEARPPTIAPHESLPRASRAGAPAFTQRYDLRFERSPWEHAATDSRSVCWIADDP